MGAGGKRCRAVLVGLALATSAAIAKAQTPSGSAGPDDWEPCDLPGLDGAARCTTYEVWEDRDARTGRKIGIRIAVLPALEPGPSPDPLVILAGGPGQGATALAGFASSTLPELRRDREIVLIDQRGTGASNPLTCDLPGSDEDLQAYLGPLLPTEPIRACMTELQARADLTLYTTPIAMDDLDEIRGWLGYRRINLYGTSYGTRAAQVYMRRHPEHVRSVVLSGVVPMRFKMPLYHAKGAQAALDGLFRACAGDDVCGSTYPGLGEKFTTVMERLREAPVSARIAHPADGAPVTVQLTKDAFASTLRFMLYSPSTARQIPAFIERAYAEGDFGPFATFGIAIRRTLVGGVNVGMHLSVTCAEDVALIESDEIGRETRETFLGDSRVRQQRAACELWPKGSLPADYHDPVRSEIPVLLIAGELDPVTPPWTAEQIARDLLNSVVVVVPGGAHSNSSPCVSSLIRSFVEAATVEALDTSCARRVEPPAFLIQAQKAEG